MVELNEINFCPCEKKKERRLRIKFVKFYEGYFKGKYMFRTQKMSYSPVTVSI